MSDTIVQYKTNNDGTPGDMIGGSTISQEVKDAVSGGIGTGGGGAPPSFQQIIDAVQADENIDPVVYLSETGSYYLSKLPLDPGDQLVVSASPALVTLLESSGGPVKVETANDIIVNAAGAGILGVTAADGVKQ